MSHVQNNWRPSADLSSLKQRAEIIKTIRYFFYQRDILEVDTPCMGSHTVTDPFIQSIKAQCNQKSFYLQTSPEYHMKRLLAAGSGDIFQICKSFRNDEAGKLHNNEFTLLEWYRVGFNAAQLMAEVETLLRLILHCNAANYYSYQEIFLKYLTIDPLTATTKELAECASDLDCPDFVADKDAWLQILFTEKIEPQLHGLNFIYQFPVSQAALAKINPDDPRVAERFEAYYNGIELANGFDELTDAEQQLQRFEDDNKKRQHYGFKPQAIDPYFIAALEHGLPDCAGVALGVDRLIMLATGETNIKNIVSFTNSYTQNT